MSLNAFLVYSQLRWCFSVLGMKCSCNFQLLIASDSVGYKFLAEVFYFMVYNFFCTSVPFFVPSCSVLWRSVLWFRNRLFSKNLLHDDIDLRIIFSSNYF